MEGSMEGIRQCMPSTYQGTLEFLERHFRVLRDINQTLDALWLHTARLTLLRNAFFEEDFDFRALKSDVGDQESKPDYSTNPMCTWPHPWQDWLRWADDMGLRKSAEAIDIEREKIRHIRQGFERWQFYSRSLISTAWRPYQRGLTLLDLPDEILLMILGNLDCPDGFPHSCRNWHRWTEELINLRLTCRRLCNLVSPLLVRVVHVRVGDKAALTRLNNIAHHPLISQGVLRLCVSLTRYNATIADDFGVFVSYAAESLREAIKREKSLFAQYAYRDENVFAMLRIREKYSKDARGILSVLRRIKSVGGDSSLPSNIRPDYDRILKLHQDYRALFAAQESLKVMRFAKAIGSAVAGLPRARGLDFIDYDYTQECGIRSWSIEPDIWKELQENALKPISGKKVVDCGLPPPSYQPVSEIVDAIRAAGVFLDSINIDLAVLGRRDSLFCNRFGPGMQQLTKLHIKCHQRGLLSRKQESEVEPFLLSLLDIPTLEELAFQLTDTVTNVYEEYEFDGDRTYVPTPGQGRFLPGTHIKHRLTKLCLAELDISFAALTRIIKRMANPVRHLQFERVKLLDGTWRAIFDLVREKKIVGLLSFRVLRGAECDTMSGETETRIFGEPALAVAYMRRAVNHDINPLADYEDEQEPQVWNEESEEDETDEDDEDDGDWEDAESEDGEGEEDEGGEEDEDMDDGE